MICFGMIVQEPDMNLDEILKYDVPIQNVDNVKFIKT